ncbi:hypothetical protein evm_012358 [Chilo suppressalis]|nr:hypothetical protein evm_012358 [Chilo suppressalis]
MPWHSAGMPRYLSGQCALTQGKIPCHAVPVCVEIIYDLVSSPAPIVLSQHICKLFKLKWASEFVAVFSNINPNKCPVSGYCVFTNMELPPKNFPLPIPKGKNFLNISAHLTKTKEILGNFTINVTVL